MSESSNTLSGFKRLIRTPTFTNNNNNSIKQSRRSNSSNMYNNFKMYNYNNSGETSPVTVVNNRFNKRQKNKRSTISSTEFNELLKSVLEYKNIKPMLNAFKNENNIQRFLMKIKTNGTAKKLFNMKTLNEVLKNSKGNLYIPLLTLLNNKKDDYQGFNYNNTLKASGRFSNVFLSLKLGQYRKMPYVLKIVKTSDEIDLKNELYGCLINFSLMKKLNNDDKKYFAGIYEVGIRINKDNEEKNLYALLEKCDSDAYYFFDKIEEYKPDKYNEQIIQRIKIFNKLTFDLLKAMTILHNLGYTHLDIKPENILVNNLYGTNQDFKLSDYSTLTAIGTPLKIIKGTVNYFSPILFTDIRVKKVATINREIFDYYSVGITLFKLLNFLFYTDYSNEVASETLFPFNGVSNNEFIQKPQIYYEHYKILEKYIIYVLEIYVRKFKNVQKVKSDIELFQMACNLIISLLISNLPENINNFMNSSTNTDSIKFYNYATSIITSDEIKEYITKYEEEYL